ncbi:MAG: hypothetical protein H6733_18010 [Alphaproteobacteria bacterium]|nr:hypothetical protein [Alphaproteobacteria bacterium]
MPRPAAVPLQVVVRLTDVPGTWNDAPLVVGLQSGSTGSGATIVPGDPDGDDVVFEGAIDVRPTADGAPDFFGPLVHGPRGARHLYVTWARVEGGTHAMFRRLKLYLTPTVRAAWTQPGVSWDQVHTGRVAASVSGRGPDGTPHCGSAEARWG